MADVNQNLNVLIVEDSKDDALLMIRELKNDGFQIQWKQVQTEKEFSSALNSQQWDIILSDYRMPKFQCPKALELLQKSGKDIPFIIISGAIGEETAVELMVAGAADFILKDSLIRLAPAVRRELREAANRKLKKQAEKDSEAARTHEKHLNALLKSIRDINKLIVKKQQKQPLIEAICKSLVSTRGLLRAWIILTDNKQEDIVCAQSGFSKENFEITMEQIKKGIHPKCMDIADTQDDTMSLIEPDKHCYGCPLFQDTDQGIRLAVNLIHAKRRYGVLCISVPTEYAHDTEEQEFLLEIADDIALALYGIATDTERKKAERDLRAERERLQMVIQGSQLGTWIWDPKSDEIILNEQWASMLGYTIEELSPFTYKKWEQLVHPDDIEKAVTRVNKCLKGETNEYECELRMLHKDGHWVWILDRASIMTQEVEGISKAMFGTQSDITNRKQAEEQLLRSEQELRAAQKVAHLGSWSMNLKTNEVTWSKPLYNMYDFDPSQPVPPYTEHEKLFTPESWELLSYTLENTSKTGTPYEIELQTVKADKSNGWIWARGEVVRNFSGDIVGLRGVAQDITDRKHLEEQISQTQRLDAVGQLAGGVAHDFNNLLMGIMGYTELCRDGIDKNHPIREWLDEITKETERSAAIIRQLLAFSRKQTIAPRILNLNDIVANMLKMMQRLITEDIDLSWHPGANLQSVKMDPGQVDQILANLCVNARDAIKGVGSIIIETKNIQLDKEYCATHPEVSPGPFVMLAVSDSGCGMDANTISNIFEPFFTTKEEGKGTGLGLATVYGIVKQNNGSIHVYSELKQGSTFKIYFPAIQDEYAAQQQESISVNMLQGNETILLVEDEKSIRLTLTMYLNELGYNVLPADTPATALKIAEEHRGKIDAIITDVVMPGMNGKEFVEMMENMYSKFKVLYISGYTADVIANRGILEDGVEFLAKPVMRDILAKKIRQILDKEQ